MVRDVAVTVERFPLEFVGLLSLMVDISAVALGVVLPEMWGSRVNAEFEGPPLSAPERASLDAHSERGKTPSQPRVLVADDHDDARRLFVLMFQTDGWACDEASDGAQAVRSARLVSYDLILMDLRMPVLSGLEAIRQLRASGVWTKVLAVTADILQSAESDVLAAGADGYVTKPISRADLLRICREMVPRTPGP